MNERAAPIKRPWLEHYVDIPAESSIPDLSIYEQLLAAKEEYPANTAFTYMGRDFSYPKFVSEIDRCAAALSVFGIGKGDTVTLAMPNTPGAVFMFYALDKVGATVAMTHPLSSASELEYYLNLTGSRWAVTVDMFYSKFADILERTKVERLLICGLSDYLPHKKKIGFRVTKGRKIEPIPEHDKRILRWKDFVSASEIAEDKPYERVHDPKDTSVILFSGGTTNKPKGIRLSAYNINALCLTMANMTKFASKDTMLTILPIFHGFGLGLCVHGPVCAGGRFILVPEFSTKIYISNLRKYKPSYIAGVPTLFEALLRDKHFAKVRFDKLKGAFCGGDSLSWDLKERFDRTLSAQGSKTELIEGYGLTECVTACIISPYGQYRKNSMGIPIQNTDVKVVDPDTLETLPPGADGEICIAGPTVMQAYLDDEEASAQTLRRHADGRLWLHSGDIGSMDADGYFYFKNRIKRILKVSGITVYPMQIEQVLEDHPLVQRACVIGVPDEYQMHSVKAFIILADKDADGGMDEETIRKELHAYCKKELIKWAVPKKIEFIDSLPMTLVGKIAYAELM